MWLPWRPYNPSAYDDDFEGQPTQGPFYQWGLGLVLPIIAMCHGASALMAHAATVGQSRTVLHGHTADAYGVAVLALAVFLHCHYFWGNIYDQIWFAVLGKIVSAATFIASLIYFCIHFGIFGLNR